MARLFSSGFELQSLSTTSSVEWNKAASGVGAIATNIVRNGAASYRINPTASKGQAAHAFLSADGTGTYYFRIYMYIASMPTSVSSTTTGNNTDVVIMDASDAALSSWAEVTLDASGVVRVYQDGTTRTVVGTSSALSTSTWHMIELAYGSAASYVEARVDGVSIGSTSSAAGLSAVSIMYFGVGALTGDQSTSDIYFDDAAVNDTTGSVQTSWAGQGSIIHMLPDSAGDTNGFATAVGGTAGAANNWTRVDEISPDDSTSYNETSSANTSDEFGMQTSASAGIGASDTITLVQVGIRLGSNGTSTVRSLNTRLKSQASGTVLTGATATANLNGWATHTHASQPNYLLTSYVDTQAGGAWTPPLLDTSQIGYKTTASSSLTVRVSNVWALVEFVPAIVDLNIQVMPPAYFINGPKIIG